MNAYAHDLNSASQFAQTLVALTADVFTAGVNNKGAWIISATARLTGPGAAQTCRLRIKTDNIDILAADAAAGVNDIVTMPNAVYVPSGKGVEAVTGDKCEMRCTYRLLV